MDVKELKANLKKHLRALDDLATEKRLKGIAVRAESAVREFEKDDNIHGLVQKLDALSVDTQNIETDITALIHKIRAEIDAYRNSVRSLSDEMDEGLREHQKFMGKK